MKTHEMPLYYLAYQATIWWVYTKNKFKQHLNKKIFIRKILNEYDTFFENVLIPKHGFRLPSTETLPALQPFFHLQKRSMMNRYRVSNLSKAGLYFNSHFKLFSLFYINARNIFTTWIKKNVLKYNYQQECCVCFQCFLKIMMFYIEQKLFICWRKIVLSRDFVEKWSNSCERFTSL